MLGLVPEYVQKLTADKNYDNVALIDIEIYKNLCVRENCFICDAKINVPTLL
ncbi:hypothetical protein METHB2_1070003 [Candidatus Methylobacter favarea]|uniref:Uncharacterized protein n=1 Tax=Candidatus Methylobacter favarea TaxID=2707345 RepID=A0A8S0XH84_9GAMM|nr:hypothetical protein METHB2_1070003 [Candidatus Methylobacter favarea]